MDGVKKKGKARKATKKKGHKKGGRNMIGRASKACKGKGKRARSACMKKFFKKHGKKKSKK